MTYTLTIEFDTDSFYQAQKLASKMAISIERGLTNYNIQPHRVKITGPTYGNPTKPYNIDNE